MGLFNSEVCIENVAVLHLHQRSFLYSLCAHIITPNGLMKFAVKVVISSMAAALLIHSQYSEATFSITTSLYKLGKASFPCGLKPLPQAVICSNWGNLAGFPKRSFNPFTPVATFLHIATQSPLFFGSKLPKNWAFSLLYSVIPQLQEVALPTMKNCSLRS